MTTVGRFYSALGAFAAPGETLGPQGLESLLGEAFDAFDTDQSGDMSYEEFVMMVSSRGPGPE